MQASGRVSDTGQGMVGIRIRIPVTREMFGGAKHTPFLQSFDVGPSLPADIPGIFPEGAAVDLRLDDRSYDLADIPELVIQERQQDMMPAAAVTIDNMDGSRVVRTFHFEAP